MVYRRDGNSTSGNARSLSSGKLDKQNIPNSPGGGVMPRACVFHNQGVCANKRDHRNGQVLWKHVCKRCFSPDHTELSCPLLSNGTGRS
jgi:hypothetical protein